MKTLICKTCKREVTWDGNREIDENNFECAKCEAKRLNGINNKMR